MNAHDTPDAPAPDGGAPEITAITDEDSVQRADVADSPEPAAMHEPDAVELLPGDRDDSDATSDPDLGDGHDNPGRDEDPLLSTPAPPGDPSMADAVLLPPAAPAPSPHPLPSGDSLSASTAAPSAAEPSATAPSTHAASSTARAVAAAAEAPRTRWGGIIWGLVFLALAGIGYWSTTALSADFLADIWLRITPLAVGAGMVFIVGAIAVLCALVALARHLQRRSAAQRSLL